MNCGAGNLLTDISNLNCMDIQTDCIFWYNCFLEFDFLDIIKTIKWRKSQIKFSFFPVLLIPIIASSNQLVKIFNVAVVGVIFPVKSKTSAALTQFLLVMVISFDWSSDWSSIDHQLWFPSERNRKFVYNKLQIICKAVHTSGSLFASEKQSSTYISQLKTSLTNGYFIFARSEVSLFAIDSLWI